MSFTTLLDSIRATDSGYRVAIDASWGQGRATFGGAVAGIANEVLRRLVPRERPLRSLHTTFVGPAASGEWHLRAEVVRVGKSVSVARCDVVESDRIAATVIGVYGGARTSAVEVPLEAIAPLCSVAELPPPQMQHAPTFTGHFDYRWARAASLFSSADNMPTQVYVRHRHAARMDESHLIALIDCIPSPALAMFRAPAPASSLTWTVELIEPDIDVASDAWWRLDTRIDAAANGYVHETGVLHDPAGRAVALTRQLVAVFG
jgi:acyl-CoA thioesterase